MFNLSILMVGVFCLAAYMMGNISPSIILGKVYGIDIRKEGSGNAGTTNALRVLGKKAAVITLLIDVLKGVIAIRLGALVLYRLELPFDGEHMLMIMGLCVVVGHIWPVCFGFKGGKGVATIFGVLLATAPILAFAELGIMALMVLVSRMVSLGAVTGALAFPFLVHFYEPDYLYWGIILAVIVLYKHNANIGRIIKGEESKLGEKK